MTSAVAKAPATLSPMAVLSGAFHSVEQLLEANRPLSLPRQRVIGLTPALQERELAKVAALAEALALALCQRGVDERLAALAAQTGMATFRCAVVSWFADPTGGLGAHLDRAFDELDGLASSFSTTRKARRRQ